MDIFIPVDFESRFDEESFRQWTKTLWPWTPLLSAVYTILTLLGRHYMKHRERFELRTCFLLWTMCNLMFAITGCSRLVPELIYVIQKDGWVNSVCNPGFYGGPSGCWLAMLAIYKILHFGETVFVVLRKNNLTFNHVYHHAIMCVYVMYTHPEHPAPHRWLTITIHMVHPS